jgi:predicted nucleic acid-binding protein
VAGRRRRDQLIRRSGAVPDALLLDSEALSAGAEGNPRVRAELAMAERLGVVVHVSSVTLAETLRGHRRDARVHLTLAGTQQETVTPALGRAAGELLGRLGRSDTVDAIVAVTARALGGRVRLLTGDPDDMRTLAAEMAGVTVVPV